MKTLLTFIILTTSFVSFGQQHHFYQHYFNNKSISFKSISSKNNVLTSFPDFVEKFKSTSNKDFSMLDYNLIAVRDLDREKKHISSENRKERKEQQISGRTNYFAIDDLASDADKIELLNKHFSTPLPPSSPWLNLNLKGLSGIINK